MRAARDKVAELVTLRDDPREPLVGGVRALVSPPVASAPLEAAVRWLLATYPRLRSRPVLEPSGLRWVDERERLDALVERAIASRETDGETFFGQPIPLTDAPLWRVLANDGGELRLLVHHALIDGRSGQLLFALLLQAIACFERGEVPKVFVPTDETPQAEPGPIGKALDLGRYVAELLYLGRRHPPVLLGPPDVRRGDRHHHLFTEVPADRVAEVRRRAAARVPGVTVNDLLVAAFHLALHDAADRHATAGVVHGGTDRITTSTPVDLRGGVAPGETFGNCVTEIRLHSFRAQRGSDTRLLSALGHQRARARRRRLWFMGLDLLRLGRQTDRPSPWRFYPTACLSNLGRLELPAEITPRLRGLYAFPPTMPPCGLSMAALTFRDTLYLGQRTASATVEAELAGFVLDRTVNRLLSLAEG